MLLPLGIVIDVVLKLAPPMLTVAFELGLVDVVLGEPPQATRVAKRATVTMPMMLTFFMCDGPSR
jgi:hypothetical protein